VSFVDTWCTHDFRSIAERIARKSDADVQRALSRGAAAMTLEDFAALLSPAASPYLETMAQQSHLQTVQRFGRTMQIYAPLYLSNVCRNICSYCGYSAQNRIKRLVLDDNAISAEAAVLTSMGLQHVLLLTGESPRVGPDYLAHALALLRPHFASLSFEVQPFDIDTYVRFAAEGMNAVMVYQETYDKEMYPHHHLHGPKVDMTYRLETSDRLGQAGIKKVGIGALYGLSNWRAEAWFVGLHLRYLETTYWQMRTSISFPRLRPHEGTEGHSLAAFGERDLVQTICAFRLLSPEVELSLSTRESAHFRNHAFRLGITSMSAGSRTNPGGYATAPESLEQFTVDDTRSPAAVAGFLRSQGYEPVWKDWDETYDGQRSPRHSGHRPP
jgi:2-iminoacetate synthase